MAHARNVKKRKAAPIFITEDFPIKSLPFPTKKARNDGYLFSNRIDFYNHRHGFFNWLSSGKIKMVIKNPHIRQHPTPPITTIDEAREFHAKLAAEEKKIVAKKEEGSEKDNG